jgi:hypothetical protein
MGQSRGTGASGWRRGPPAGSRSFLGGIHCGLRRVRRSEAGHEKNLSRATEVFALLDQEFAALQLTLRESAGRVISLAPAEVGCTV